MPNFKPIKTMSTTLKVHINVDGYIAQPGDTVAATKKFSLKGLAITADLNQTDTVWQNLFSNICGGSYDLYSTVREFKGGVENA